MSKIRLLSMLADGEFHSGQVLAAALGVSRTAIWKQLKQLEEQGLELDSVRGLGYRITGGVELLVKQDIVDSIEPAVRDRLGELLLFDVIDSTNAEALRRIGDGAGCGLVVSAEQQSAGRGRRGRPWMSPFGRNIYLSVVGQFSQGAGALEGLSLAVGVCVVRVLARLGISGLQLKWPNDLLYKGAKAGGILLEMVGDTAGLCQVVVGVGVNVAMPSPAAAKIDQPWTDLSTIAIQAGVHPPPRNLLLAKLISELLSLLQTFEASGFSPWRQHWMALDAFAGQPVVVSSAHRQIGGVARGVDKRGALQLETSLGLQSLYGGEISLRPAL
ncbi:MAG: bifunctional biotin--[acetyl-CoA-carboxylase] ligase/biotin operon repressor BirA [Parahaliea sp.]